MFSNFCTGKVINVSFRCAHAPFQRGSRGKAGIKILSRSHPYWASSLRTVCRPPAETSKGDLVRKMSSVYIGW